MIIKYSQRESKNISIETDNRKKERNGSRKEKD